MKRYRMEVVTQTLLVIADCESEAEAKYASFFHSGELCPCGFEECACVEECDEIFHSTDLDLCPEVCGTCGEYGRSNEGEFSFAHPLYLVFTCGKCVKNG